MTIKLPTIAVGPSAVLLAPFHEGEAAAHRTAAHHALEHARALPAWHALQRQSDVENFVEGAARLAAGDYPGAAAWLAKVADDPLLGGAATPLQAIALHIDRRFAESAAVSDRLLRKAHVFIDAGIVDEHIEPPERRGDLHRERVGLFLP